MRRLVMMFSVLVLFALSASAQDYVIKKSGEEVASIVEEVGPDYVRYRLWSEPDGVLYTVNKSEVLLIRYATGRDEIFDYTVNAQNIPVLKYREMAKLYDYRDYQPSFYDVYSPAGSGVASFFVPGLGQMMCGEVGRGFAWFGGSIGCYILTSAAALYEEPALLIMGLAGMLAIDVCAIVDGVRVAKVKNMYRTDVIASRYAVDVDMYPSVNYVKTATGLQPTAGMTLAFRF